MRIFVLEDNENRIKFFAKFLRNHDAVIADNVEDAKKILGYKYFDMLFLDHDLGGEVLVDSSQENTGYQLVKYIVNKKLQKDSIFVLHSQNPVGAINMLELLKNNKYRVLMKPFTYIYNEVGPHWMNNKEG